MKKLTPGRYRVPKIGPTKKPTWPFFSLIFFPDTIVASGFSVFVDDPA